MRRPCLALIAATFMLVAACSSASDDGSATATDGVDATAQTQGRAEEDVPATELREIPPLTLPSQPVGTAEAYDALIARLKPFVTDAQQQAGVPWPDLRNADPAVAYQETAAFQQWMMRTNSSPPLTEAYTAPNSPERSFDVEMFDQMNRLGVLSTPDDPPYSMQIEAVVHPAATSITDALLADVPAGSVAVVYFDSAGTSEMLTESGIVVNRSPGWTNAGPWVAIMEPTDVGWQVWWDELTDPLPPGQRYDRGSAPKNERPRVRA